MTSSIERAPLFTGAFLLASVSHFLHGLSFHLYLHLPGFLQRLGADESLIGLLYGMAAAGAIAARPAIGREMDRRGRTRIIILGGVLTTSMCLAYFFVDAIGPLVFVVRACQHLGQAMLFASLFAFASDIVPASRRIEGIALFGVSGILPMAIGGLIGDAVLARASYTALFATSGTCSLVALALSLPLRDVAPAEGPPPRGLMAALRQKDLVPLWFAGVVFATAIMAIFAFLKTYVLLTGIGSLGLFFSVYSGAAILLRLFLGGLPERLGPHRVLLPSIIATGLGFVVLAFATHAGHLAVAGALCGLGHGYTFPILLGLVVQRARPSERGAALSIFTALFDTGMLVGSPLLGLVIEHAGYLSMFSVAAGIVFVGAGIFLWWEQRFQVRAPPPG